MGDKFPRWSARNPLGIIALFISLIYGMSALLLGTSVESLATSNQTILVWFVVSFPFVVLGVFAWFVAKHHKKLYGPADFRSDEAFHAVQDLPPADLGRRLSQEIERDLEEPIAGTILDREDGALLPRPSPSTDQPAAHRGPAERDAAPQLRRQTWTSQKNLITRAFLAEALVFQELQRELGGAIRRQVALPLRGGQRFRADGVIEIGNSVIIVEVNLVRSVISLRRILNQSIRMFEDYKKSMDEQEAAVVKFILALVVADGSTQPDWLYSAVEELQRQVQSAIQIRLFFLQDLMFKYGIPLPDEKTDDEAEPPAAKTS